MDRVLSLGEVDLSAVLGISVTAETRLRLAEIGSRIDLLRLPGDERGWVIGQRPPALTGGQPLPLALGTAAHCMTCPFCRPFCRRPAAVTASWVLCG